MLLAPLVVGPGLLFPYVTARAVFFRVLIQISLVVLLFLVLRRRVRAEWRGDIVLQALLVFLATQLIAAVAGEAPMRSIFGDLERMWGVWAWAHVIAYYILIRTFLRSGDWQRYLEFALAVGVAVALYAMFKVATAPPGFALGLLPSVGNSGLFAGLELVTTGIAALLFVRARDGSRRIMFFVAGMAAIGGILVSQNRSTVLGLVLAAITLVLIRANRRALLAPILLAVLLIGGIGVFELGQHTRLPGALGRIASTNVFGLRSLEAEVTVRGVAEYPLLGVGPENFDFLWSRHFKPIVYKVEPDIRADREHNALLEAVATSGLLGGAAFVLIWVALFASLVRGFRKGSLSLEEAGVCAGMCAGYAAYLLFYFVDINALIPFVAVAAFVATSANGTLLVAAERRRWTIASSAVLALGALLFAVVLYFDDVAPLKLARSLVTVALANAPIETSLHDAYSAFGSPAPERSQTIVLYAGYIEKLAPILPNARREPYERAVLDTAFQTGGLEFDRQIAREPTNLRLLLLRGRFLFLAAEFYGNPALYEPAEQDLRRVVELSPARIAPHLLLSSIRLEHGDKADALAEARKAVAIDSAQGEPHFFLAQALLASDSALSGAGELKRSLELHYMGAGATFRSAAFLLEEKALDAQSADLITAYLTTRYGPLEVWDRFTPQPRMVEAADSAMLLALPLADQKANRADAARVAAAALAVAIPGSGPKPLSAR